MKSTKVKDIKKLNKEELKELEVLQEKATAEVKESLVKTTLSTAHSAYVDKFPAFKDILNF